MNKGPLIRALAGRLGILVTAIVLMALVAGPGAAAEGDKRVARLSPSTQPVVERGGNVFHPQLGNDDIIRYRRAFALQEAGRFNEADQVLTQLGSKVLLGHVLAARYVHPDYRASYGDLVSWLQRYADLPQAAQIHKLAMSRHKRGAALPPKPIDGSITDKGRVVSDRTRAQPRTLLDQGLRAWRSRDFKTAASRFAQVANSETAQDEDVAAGAFWAARAQLLAGQPQQVGRFLRVAARTRDEFYGSLARAMLGQPASFEWQEQSLRAEMVDLLVRYPGSRRAIALDQIDEQELAESEIRMLAIRSPVELTAALSALAEALGLPAAQMQAGDQLRRLDGRRHDGALYPIPKWKPSSGTFRLDRALIYAVMRAESGFDARAKSPKGATGVMQVMPDTADLVVRRHKVAYAGVRSLLHPPTNIEIGQTWLWRLAQTSTIDNSVIHLVAAYNAGENRLRSWVEGPLRAYRDDPLLFIESLPIDETRAYVKKVLGNLWVYRARLGQDTPELKALAENRWPELIALDPSAQRYARKN